MIQQTSSKCIQNARANALCLLDCGNTLLVTCVFCLLFCCLLVY